MEIFNKIVKIIEDVENDKNKSRFLTKNALDKGIKNMVGYKKPLFSDF